MTIKCYIAGPMRGIPKYNYPLFTAAAKHLRILGYEVINPAELNIAAGELDWIDHTLEEQNSNNTPKTARKFAIRDVGVLVGVLRAENKDVVVTLPGWENSIGAQAEVAIARWVGLEITTLEDVDVGM